MKKETGCKNVSYIYQNYTSDYVLSKHTEHFTSYCKCCENVYRTQRVPSKIGYRVCAPFHGQPGMPLKVHHHGN